MRSFTLALVLAAPASGFMQAGSMRSMASKLSSAAVEEVVEPVKVLDKAGRDITDYPSSNGWTPDASKFCYGLPGSLAPVGDFDPVGFTNDLSLDEVKRYREAEVTHGRVAMTAVLGFLVAESFHPLFGGNIDGPAIYHLGKVREVAPLFFDFLAGTIACAELYRSLVGWVNPTQLKSQNAEFIYKLNDGYYPGDIGFDPAGLKPTNAAEFAEMQTKELQNGRLAMLAAMGFIVQETVNSKGILENLF